MALNKSKNKIMKQGIVKNLNRWGAYVFAIFTLLLTTSSMASAQPVPNYFVYEGRLLTPAGEPVETAQDFRFSFWKSSDFVASDEMPDGSINSGAPNYGGWQEENTITPNATGVFLAELGKNVPLLQIDPSVHLYLQVEIKPAGAPLTDFELLDPTGDNAIDLVDRNLIGSVPYAIQADNASQSLDEEFILDADNTVEGAGAGEIKLQFGKTLNKYLSYNYNGNFFYFNDDLHIDGNLDVNGTISGFSNRGTVNDGSSLTVTHPSSANHYFTTTALKYIQNSGLIDSNLDYQTVEEALYAQEDQANGTDFESDLVKLHDSGSGLSSNSFPYDNPANYTYNSSEIDVAGSLATLKPTELWGKLFTYYKMDGTWGDSSDNNNITTSSGGPTFDSGDFKVGTASGQFDGNDDYIIINPVPASFPTTEITAEFWVKTSDTTKNGSLLSYATTSNNNEFLIFNYKNIAIFRGGTSVGTGVAVNDGNWHHVVVTWRGSDGRVQLYDNATLAYTGTLASGTSITGGGAVVIGQEQDNVGGGFQITQAFLGRFDNFAVYSTILSSSEVTDHYNTGIGKELTKYPNDKPVIQSSQFSAPASMTAWESFSEVMGGGNTGNTCYTFSTDNGTTWRYWDGASWAVGGSSTNCNSAGDANSHINSLDSSTRAVTYRAYLVSDGNQQVSIDTNAVGYNQKSYPVGQAYFVSTTDTSALNTTIWEKINSASITESTPVNTAVKYLVSFDGRTTWKYWDGGAWQVSVDTSSGGVLTDANAFTNANDKTTIEGITPTQWSTLGGFDQGTTTSLDVAIDLETTNSTVSPSVSLIEFNYDEIGIWQQILGTEADNFPIEFITPTQTRITNNSGTTEKLQLFVR